MRQERKAIRDHGVLDPLNIRLHERSADLLPLVFRQNRQRMDRDGAALLLVAKRLTGMTVRTRVLGLGLPVGREGHRSIGHTRRLSPSRNDMTDQGRTRFGLVGLLGRKCEETQAQLGGLCKAVDELRAVSNSRVIQTLPFQMQLKMGRKLHQST